MAAKKRTGPGGPRVGAGRKPLPEDERRDASVFVRFTRQEMRDLERAAEGKPLASFIRGLVLRFLARRRR